MTPTLEYNSKLNIIEIVHAGRTTKADLTAVTTKGIALSKEKGITTVILCGLLTDVCVEATMRIAYDKWFEVFTVTDATATLDVNKQEATVETSFPLFSKPVNTETAMAMIEA